MTEVKTPLGKRAIVIGGSLAGMLAVRAVAPHFEDVVVLERDEFAGPPAPRMSAPQSYHLHVLLKGGENAMERLAPGFRAAIERSGSETLNPGQEFTSASDLGVAARYESRMRVHGQSRWLLEDCLRSQVVSLTDNLTLRCGVTVRGLLHDPVANRVTAYGWKRMVSVPNSRPTWSSMRPAVARAPYGGSQHSACRYPRSRRSRSISPTPARLSVSPRTRAWLEGARRRQSAESGRAWRGTHADRRRAARLLGRRSRRRLSPGRPRRFPNFVRALPHPALADALERAEFVRPIARLIYPANRLRHYERCDALPRHSSRWVTRSAASTRPTAKA